MSRDARIEKLPKWAQDYIQKIEQERAMAIRTLNDFQDSQAPSPIYIEDNSCTGEAAGPIAKRKYIQAYKVYFDYAGMELVVTTWEDNLRLNWNGLQGRELALIPEGYQQARLVTKENMR